MPRPIIFRLAGRYISRRFFQSVLYILGVALGVAVVIAIDIANGSANRAFDLSADSVSGAATHQVVGGPAGLPTDVYRKIRVDLGIRDSAPVVEQYVQSIQLGEQPLRLLGVDPFAEAPFRPYLTAVNVDSDNTDDQSFAALTLFIAEPGTVLISESMAERNNVQIGDTIAIRAGAQTSDVRIVGLLQPDDRVSEQAIDDLMLADIATAQEIVGKTGRITRVDLIIPDSQEAETLSAIRAILPEGIGAGAVQLFFRLLFGSSRNDVDVRFQRSGGKGDEDVGRIRRRGDDNDGGPVYTRQFQVAVHGSIGNKQVTSAAGRHALPDLRIFFDDDKFFAAFE
jgi:putative ABC transport system permease protein